MSLLKKVLHDASLVIGDPAIEAKKSGLYKLLGLALIWKELTGLPFVFAEWFQINFSEESDILSKI